MITSKDTINTRTIECDIDLNMDNEAALCDTITNIHSKYHISEFNE